MCDSTVSGFEEEFNIDIDPEKVVEMYRDYSTFKRVIHSRVGEKGGAR